MTPRKCKPNKVSKRETSRAFVAPSRRKIGRGGKMKVLKKRMTFGALLFCCGVMV